MTTWKWRWHEMRARELKKIATTLEKHSYHTKKRKSYYRMHSEVLSGNCSSCIIAWCRFLDNKPKKCEKTPKFHRSLVRHVASKHMRKLEETWEHSHHDELCDKAKLLPTQHHIERRRGNLILHLENNRPQLLKEVEETITHCYDPNKVLWWNQTWTEKLQ